MYSPVRIIQHIPGSLGFSLNSHSQGGNALIFKRPITSRAEFGDILAALTLVRDNIHKENGTPMFS